MGVSLPDRTTENRLHAHGYSACQRQRHKNRNEPTGIRSSDGWIGGMMENAVYVAQ
jgi:hypothetical protein